MVFSSLTFLFLYFPIVLVVMKLAPLKYRNFILFIVSLFFYGWGEPRYIVIMVISILVNYVAGYQVEKHAMNKAVQHKILVACIVFNLALLGFFKYYDFFVGNLNSLGLHFLSPLGLALPIGISFYTFQAMSYPIDVYRKEATAQKSVVNFGAYVTMFPQLIAGPIVRYKDIAEQLNHRTETLDGFYQGIQRFMVGLCKKVLLANSIGLVWETISALSQNDMTVLTAWIGIIAYAFQIYYDFSGYSDMAIGLGKMFGFDFLENFNYPYIARTVTDFWKRWHISLSTWFRDYVYIPLGGSRRGKALQLRNLLIVWILTGFWHGASWNFIFWGLFYAVMLILEKLFLLKWFEKIPHWIGHVYTLVVVLIAWVFFAFTDVSMAFRYIGNMFGTVAFANAETVYFLRNNFVLLIMCILCATPIMKSNASLMKLEKKMEMVYPIIVLIGLVACTACIVDASYNPFLYFRF